jgi:glutamyl/glutaminyl-tRNA synthetase
MIAKQDRILITGGAGFLGSFVIERLRARGYSDLVVPRRKEYDLTREQDVERLYADFDPKAVDKGLKADNNAGLTILRDLRAALAALSDWTPKGLHTLLETQATSRGLVSEKGANIGPIAQPLRVAIAGSAVTPPLGETLAILGPESTLRRIDTCLRTLAT